ncbi:TAXI family TRAP transporter solute-binding subunit [Salipiger marinus]|uniref:TAXI family TRAP transporter solute-binding subunit n=1 Tax=Salipiger marinus TaxID=555512 RepID=UPI002BD257FF|nr:TAXI family TRAP transporter solute-binding subunit [Salipiger manganoxidans]MEB3419814.1 TAXI family TRAP transporter solute-binding subunit [Salipiger manganoxidans]
MRHLFKATLAAGLVLALPAQAETRVTFKAAKTGSSYYQMSVQVAEAMKAGTDGAISVTVEESQGSQQNVMEVRARGADYVFTSPPALVAAAQSGTGAFDGKGNPAFDEIRALFPLPSLTMHFVMSADSGVTDYAGLEGHSLLLGKGSFGASEGAKYLTAFGLDGKVEIADVELSNAVPALQNGQIDGFVTAGSWPAPNVVEAAASVPVTLLSMTEEELSKAGSAKLVIPAGTYAGQDSDVVTTSLPVVAYATTKMDEDTAYQMTRTFWEEKERMGAESAWWTSVNPQLLENVRGKLHPGAVRYYEEAGMPVADAQK